jgi:hypothetical protein
MRRSAQRLNLELSQSGKFQSTSVSTDRIIRRDHQVFYKELTDFRRVNPNKGYGRWLWKPFLIDDKLGKLKSNSILLYIDAGCHLNLKSTKSILRLEEYRQMAIDTGGLAMQLRLNQGGQGNLAEECYNSIDLMDRLKLTERERKTMQVQATLLFIRADKDGKEFVKEWLKIAREENHRYLREDLIQKVTPNFCNYRWDQSIFSGLFKQTNFMSLPDETWWGPNWHETGRNFPIWAMRHRSGSTPFDSSFQSLPDKLLTRLNL